jgi:hypothetical protein
VCGGRLGVGEPVARTSRRCTIRAHEYVSASCCTTDSTADHYRSVCNQGTTGGHCHVTSYSEQFSPPQHGAAVHSDAGDVSCGSGSGGSSVRSGVAEQRVVSGGCGPGPFVRCSVGSVAAFRSGAASRPGRVRVRSVEDHCRCGGGREATRRADPLVACPEFGDRRRVRGGRVGAYCSSVDVDRRSGCRRGRCGICYGTVRPGCGEVGGGSTSCTARFGDGSGGRP